ncbi:MAG: hypothetical protein JXA68_09215 [Ignavibacteriales bacterium]|nr:hypothetical protein [Ignavibacteriales bacterium]
MKKINLLIVLILAILSLNQIAYAQNSTDGEITKTFKVNPGGTLKVEVDPGEIIISTWDKNEVLVKVTGLEDKDLQNVDMKQTGNNVNVNFDSEWGWSDDAKFMISIPRKFSVNIETSGGDIQIKGDIEGNTDVSTMGGDIRLSNIKGDVTGNTMGGDIRTGDITGKCKLKTMGGDIKLGQLKNGLADVTTMGGDINIKGVGSSITAKTYGGDIEVGNIGGDATVTTFGGDIKLGTVTGNAKVDTYGGDISLKSASGKIFADTKGGDITLKNISGVVDAKTAGGDIYVEIISLGKDKSNIKTSAGDITLYISSNIKATIEAEIKIKGKRDKEDELKIFSEFSTSNYNIDESGKKITATYNLNGGGKKIFLNTTNSIIKIKKLN